MQRQSLGSPGSKLCVNGGAKEERIQEDEELKRKDGLATRDEEENKLEKIKIHHHHNRSAVLRTEKSIHLIPILTISCILVLYLCSHDPSQKELVQFKGLKASDIKLDSSSTVSTDLERFMEIDKSDVFAIRGHRSLQEIDSDAKDSRLHRKFGPLERERERANVRLFCYSC